MGVTFVTVLQAGVTGCAVSFGAGDERFMVGFAHVARLETTHGRVNDEEVLGLNLRLGTRDDTIAVGFSGLRIVTPAQEGKPSGIESLPNDETSDADGTMGAAASPVDTLRIQWPLALTWTDARTGATHELGLLSTRIAEREDASLVHQRTIGTELRWSPQGIGAVAGARSAVTVRAKPDQDALFIVRYRSETPFDSRMWAFSGSPPNSGGAMDEFRQE